MQNKLPLPKAILFDKDGTLLHFSSYWSPVAEYAVDKLLLARLGSTELRAQVLADLGVVNGKTDVRGLLCGGTYGTIAEKIRERISSVGAQVSQETFFEEVVAAFAEGMPKGVLHPTSERMIATLNALKGKGCKLFVVTNDNRPVTLYCLENLGIADLFEEVVADGDGYPAKPQAGIVEYLSQKYAIARESFVMVGDSTTDMRFALNEKIPSVGVGEDEAGRDILRPYATVIAENVGALLEVFE